MVSEAISGTDRNVYDLIDQFQLKKTKFVMVLFSKFKKYVDCMRRIVSKRSEICAISTDFICLIRKQKVFRFFLKKNS